MVSLVQHAGGRRGAEGPHEVFVNNDEEVTIDGPSLPEGLRARRLHKCPDPECGGPGLPGAGVYGADKCERCAKSFVSSELFVP